MITEPDTSKKYSDLLRSEQWLEKRKQILKRDEYQCRNCGSLSGLQVHHRQYQFLKIRDRFRKPWEYNDHNLITLCARCHQVGHKKYSVPVFNV